MDTSFCCSALAISVVVCVAAAGCAANEHLAMSVDAGFRVDTQPRLPLPYRQGDATQVDKRAELFYGYNVCCGEKGVAWVLWYDLSDVGGGSRSWSPRDVTYRIKDFPSSGPGGKARELQTRSTAFRGLPAMVLDQAGNLRLLLEDPVGSADLFKTFRISPDLKAEELLQLRDEVSYSVSTEALTNMADRRLVLGTVFPVPGQPGHYFIEGNYRYVRPWDVPAMAGPQPMRRYAVEVKGIKAGRAQPITPFPADAYGDVAASAGHYFDANRKGWAVGVYRPVGFDGPNQPVMISLWDGQSWQAASFNERNLLVPPKEQGEKAWSLRPTVVLLDSHILLFEGRYCFMLAVKQKPAGGIGELVWTRGLELDEGNHFCDAVNVGDGAVAVISSDGPAPTFSYLYCGPEGMSKTERLAMRAGPSAKSFVIKATSDGVCHLVWHDSVDKTLKHQTLIRNGGPRQVAPGDG